MIGMSLFRELYVMNEYKNIENYNDRKFDLFYVGVRWSRMKIIILFLPLQSSGKFQMNGLGKYNDQFDL